MQAHGQLSVELKVLEIRMAADNCYPEFGSALR